MQQRVFEGMAGELREARRNAKELARCKEENMTLRRKLVGQEEVTTSRFPSAARRAHAVNVGTKIDHSEGHSHPSVRAGTLPPTDATHDSNPLVRFYRTEPVIQETTPANKTICQVLPEDGETSSAIQKRSGSGLPHVRSRLRYALRTVTSVDMEWKCVDRVCQAYSGPRLHPLVSIFRPYSCLLLRDQGHEHSQQHLRIEKSDRPSPDLLDESTVRYH